MDIILYGGKEQVSVNSKSLGGSRNYAIDFDGIVNFIEHQYNTTDSSSIKRWAKAYMDKIKCPSCGGSRLKKEVLYFKINNKNIARGLYRFQHQWVFKYFRVLSTPQCETTSS